MTKTLAAFLVLSAASALAAERPAYERRETWAETMLATRGHFLDKCLNGTAVSKARAADWEPLWKQFFEEWPETDWFMQDNPYRVSGGEPFDAWIGFGWFFDPERSNHAEQQLVQAALDELAKGTPRGASPPKTHARLEGRFRQLIATDTAPDDVAWLALYVDACRERRQQRLARLLEVVPGFVFTKHYTLGGSHYAYTEGQSDAQAERHFLPGAALCLARWDGKHFQVQTLLQDAGGVIRDPDVSFDGLRVLFSWKKSDREDDYHLYEMDLRSRSIRQLTEGPGVADYEGIYLPEGDILFNSTRCVQTVDCWWTEVSNLYRCNADGELLRRLAFDQVHDNYPTVTPDGRILYTRWEYNDRGQVYPQPLLQMNPDGSGQADFYGGNSWFPTTILHARGIPGTQKVVAIATGHHSKQAGKLIEIDPSRGRQENEGVQLIAPVRETPAVKIDRFGQDGELFQYPYPISESETIVAYHPVGWRWQEGKWGPRFGIYWMARDGRRELLVIDTVLPCNQPIPLSRRVVEHARTAIVDYACTTGTCYIQDVYSGPALKGIPRGTVKSLRVVSILYRAAGIGENRNGGPGGGALISTPIAIGNGAWDPKVIVGDATVHEDGSAFFTVPARTPLYFQLLDGQGRMIQSMRSWTTLQPGENASCVGCHEHKNTTPVAKLPWTTAMRTGPEQLQPFYRPPRGFSFLAEVQPILNRHCIRCHAGPSGDPPALTAQPLTDLAAKRNWPESYLALTHARPDHAELGRWRGDPDHPLVNWISAQSSPALLPPATAGSRSSKLITILDRGHQGVELSPEELRKLSAWIDLGVPCCGDYVECNSWSEAEREKYAHYAAKRERLAAEEQANVETLARPDAAVASGER